MKKKEPVENDKQSQEENGNEHKKQKPDNKPNEEELTKEANQLRKDINTESDKLSKVRQDLKSTVDIVQSEILEKDKATYKENLEKLRKQLAEKQTLLDKIHQADQSRIVSGFSQLFNNWRNMNGEQKPPSITTIGTPVTNANTNLPVFTTSNTTTTYVHTASAHIVILILHHANTSLTVTTSSNSTTTCYTIKIQ